MQVIEHDGASGLARIGEQTVDGLGAIHDVLGEHVHVEDRLGHRVDVLELGQILGLRTHRLGRVDGTTQVHGGLLDLRVARVEIQQLQGRHLVGYQRVLHAIGLFPS